MPTTCHTCQARTELLDSLVKATPHSSVKEAAHYCCYTVLPAMDAVRKHCDTAEGLCARNLWPYPNYTAMMFAHHTEAPLV
eukprot:SAG22_NODE_2939_length_2089_cov_1.138693_2_plen_81_part_00